VSDSPVSDIEVLFKEAKVRQRRRRLGWLIVVICVAAAATLVITRHTGNQASTQRSRQSSLRASLPAGTPDEIVAWTSNHHVVVISTRSGAILRTLASDVAVFEPGLPDLSVSPQGEVFFNSAPIAGVSQPGAQGDQIFSVPITGGPLREVGAGFFPQVSPNGRFLAYVASNGVGEAPYMLPSGGITIATLAGDNVSSVQTLHPDARQTGQGASDLSWSPHSDRLSFSTQWRKRHHNVVDDCVGVGGWFACFGAANPPTSRPLVERLLEDGQEWRTRRHRSSDLPAR
jgi:hypothetical protein